MEKKQQIFIPADVPEKKHDLFIKNYTTLTHNTNRLFLFSCDHKLEHLNHDFYGPSIHPQALHPEHLFRIAHAGPVGAMATHLGLIARYGKQYPDTNYVVKLNGTTNTVKTELHDPISRLLWDIDDVIAFRDSSKLIIPGIGVTVYLGNEYESEHLVQAAQVINHAHSEGLVAIVWIYFRGNAIKVENDPDLIAGAAGVATSLGADFAKIKPPADSQLLTSTQALKIASAAAGNTKLLCSGGARIDVQDYLQELYNQIHEGDTAGTATGRNIFQLPLQEAVALTYGIAALIYDNVDYKKALSVYNNHLTQKA